MEPSIADLKRKGILLTRFYAHTHPSQPNYLAAIGGDYWGLDHDDMVHIPENVSTVVDLLDYRNISWAGYFEDMPGPGYMGNYSDGQTGNGTWDYVRKHKYEHVESGFLMENANLVPVHLCRMKASLWRESGCWP